MCVCVCDAPTSARTQQVITSSLAPERAKEYIAAPFRQDRRSTPVDVRPHPLLREEELTREDQAVLARARAARNGASFQALWAGNDPKGRNDPSQGDFDLILMLLYWTGDTATNDTSSQVERLFRASQRYRAEKTDRTTAHKQYSYLQMTIYNARRKRYKAVWRDPPTQPAPSPNPEPAAPTLPAPHERKPQRQARRIQHAHQWSRRSESETERVQKLQACAMHVTMQVEQHIRSGNCGLLVANVAPGVGKSSTVATLGERSTSGETLNLAWIAERRDMVQNVQALAYYRQINPCTHINCPDHHLHNALGERGYNAWSVHKRHKLQCEYAQQFSQTGSAVYQLAHVATRYPTTHEGIIIDELDVTKWLPEREISIARLAAAAKVYATNSTADLLLRAIAATLTDAAQAKRQLHGLELFNAVNRRAGGQLTNWIAELSQDSRYTNTHPWHEFEEDDEAAQHVEALSLAPVVLPHILVALMQELVKWQCGHAWNSCLRIGPGTHGYALYITERLRFTPGEDGLPARAILDATADQEILARLTGEQIILEQAEIEPPPKTRHIAIRTGKRYGKMSLTTKRKDGSPNRDLQRAIAEARYILREEDPEGEARTAQTIGLVSFQACVDELGEALGIPEHRRLHFWAARGSNALEDCTILLVIGTPTVHPATVARLTRSLYQDDPEPVSEASNIDSQGIRRYVDPRMQRVDEYLTRAELTQCAHRSRALRAARTVVTFCLGDIGYLPATETITELPQLLPDGRERWTASREVEYEKLRQAHQELEQTGRTLAMLTVRELKAQANVSTDAAASYLRQERAMHQQETRKTEVVPTTQQDTHTHTHLCSHSSDVPHSANGSITSKGRYNCEYGTAPPSQSHFVTWQPRRGTATTPPEYRRPCARCGHIDEWVRDPSGQHWICRCYYWWYEHPEWRQRGPCVSAG